MMQSVKLVGPVKWMEKANIGGMVLWPKMMFAQPLEDIPRWLFRHELEHVYQIQRVGPWKFYFKFFLYSLRYGYHNNPYEVSARMAQHQPFTETEERLWNSREG